MNEWNSIWNYFCDEVSKSVKKNNQNKTLDTLEHQR